VGAADLTERHEEISFDKHEEGVVLVKSFDNEVANN